MKNSCATSKCALNLTPSSHIQPNGARGDDKSLKQCDVAKS
jgi:hypothetical protein